MKEKYLSNTFCENLLKTTQQLLAGEWVGVCDGIACDLRRLFYLEKNKSLNKKYLRENIRIKLQELLLIEPTTSRENLNKIASILNSIQDKELEAQRIKVESYKRINTPEELDKLRDLFVKAPSFWKEYDKFADLELDWQEISENRPFLHDLRSKALSANPLEELGRYLDFGIYPPPEVLKAIHLRYEQYLIGRGYVSLDVAFFGREHSKLNSVAYRERLQEYEVFHTLVCQSKFQLPPDLLATCALEGKTLKEMAENFLRTKGKFLKKEIDIEAFLKGYRRWKKNHNYS